MRLGTRRAVSAKTLVAFSLARTGTNPPGRLREMAWDALEPVHQFNAEIMAERTRLGAVPGEVVVVGEDSALWSLTQRLNALPQSRRFQDAYYERVIAEDDTCP